jgi:hypothetical protein
MLQAGLGVSDEGTKIYIATGLPLEVPAGTHRYLITDISY